jgi:hypothetical protein
MHGWQSNGPVISLEPPPFATREITNESAFSGVSLAESRVTA